MSRPRVVLHVGTPKSGTSGLQSLLWINRDSLRERGLLYPGRHAADHFRAVVDLRNDGYVDVIGPDIPGSWRRLADEARGHHGTTVISHELFGDRDERDIAGILSDLDFADVHVLVTARDLARQLPAAWQEELKNRHPWTFEDWLSAVRPGGQRDDRSELFWLRHDVPGLVSRWRAHLPANRIHLVTVPPPGASEHVLWERVAKVLRVVPRGERRQGPPNKSMGFVEAELVRQLNQRADYDIDWATYSTRVTAYLAGFVLPSRPASTPIRLPTSDVSWVAANARQQVDWLAASGIDVVGDLTDLLGAGQETSPPTTVRDRELLEAALDALVALLREDPNWAAMAETE